MTQMKSLRAFGVAGSLALAGMVAGCMPGTIATGVGTGFVYEQNSRGELNISLIDAAEAAGARLHFDRGLVEVDFDAKVARFRGDGAVHEHPFTALVGCDGAGSTLRTQMAARRDLGERTEWLGHGYKELEIPPARDGGFRIEPNALHIWPRGRYMCIALPNDERTFTVTLFMALHDEGHGDPNFDAVDSAAAARALFVRDFPDALPLI